MDSSDDSDDQTPFWFDDLKKNKVHLLHSLPVSGIHKAVVEGDLSKVTRCIKSGESVNKRRTHYNFSPLHMAVIFNNLEMLDYLLAEEDVEVDARCSKGRTPLYLATVLGHIECMEKLIQAGCDINVTDNYGNTALHVSVYYSQIYRPGLQQGPQIDTNDGHGRTLNVFLEILHMLLYYNADTNVLNTYECIPFMTALIHCNHEAQKVLLEYVYDFNRIFYDGRLFSSMLSFALRSNSPFVKDIIERGADINYGDDPRITNRHSAFSICLCHPLDSSIFKMVWDRLRYNDAKNTIDLFDILNYDDAVPTFLQVIIDSDNIETAVEFFSKNGNYFLFINKFAAKKFNFDQLMALTCRLLEHGFRASSYDIHAIFSHYGYCELFRILLYMDNDYSRGWLPHMAFSRVMCDIDYDLKSVSDEVNDIPKETVLQLLEFSVHPRLINALTVHYSEDERMNAILGSLPRVPSLIDLARNPSRKQIWQSFKIINTCQFYTTIDHLDIPTVYKNVLTFRRKMYVVK